MLHRSCRVVIEQRPSTHFWLACVQLDAWINIVSTAVLPLHGPRQQRLFHLVWRNRNMRALSSAICFSPENGQKLSMQQKQKIWGPVHLNMDFGVSGTVMVPYRLFRFREFPQGSTKTYEYSNPLILSAAHINVYRVGVTNKCQSKKEKTLRVVTPGRCLFPCSPIFYQEQMLLAVRAHVGLAGSNSILRKKIR